MKIKDIIKLIYYRMHILIGFLIGYYIIKFSENDSIEEIIANAILVIMISIPIIMIHEYLGEKIFKENDTLADKIMNCDLRKKNGNAYCVECSDSYTCVNHENIKA